MTLKAKVKREFLDAKPADKVTVGHDVATGIGGNAGTFATPSPTVAAMNTATTNLQNGISAAGTGNTAAKEALPGIVAAWDGVFSKAADYVDSIAQGDASKVSLSGFQHTKLSRDANTTPGQAQLKGVSSKGGILLPEVAKVEDGGEPAGYAFIVTSDDAALAIGANNELQIANGKLLTIVNSTKRAVSIGGLGAGSHVKVWAYAFNTAGTGYLSDPKTLYVQE